VDGDADLDVGDIVPAIDIVREAWPWAPVVLLTPKLKKSIAAERGGSK